VAVLALPLLGLVAVWSWPRVESGASGMAASVASFDLVLVRVHPFSHLFATMFCTAALTGGLFGLNQARPVELGAAYFCAGSAILVTFAGDLVTVFVCWELMALGSAIVIWSEGAREARAASLRYALVHLAGGVVLMAGLTAWLSSRGAAALDPMSLTWPQVVALARGETVKLPEFLILTGLLVNVGVPPLGAWLPDAYPEASPSGTVFLSAFTTKTAVFVLLTLFGGCELLVWVGLATAFYGTIYAVLENDVRRLLSYAIVNQAGFMLVGIGLGTTLAISGAAAQAFCHVYLSLLLMAAGSVVWMTGRRTCSQLGGLHRHMPLTTSCAVVGALSISAFPLTAGFVSKAMIAEAAAREHLLVVWLVLTAGFAGVFFYSGLKLPWFVFFGSDCGLRPRDPPWNMRLAMILTALLCLLPGVFPGLLYALLPAAPDYEPYTYSHVVGMLQLLLFAGLAFFVLLPPLRRTETITLDVDWLYRRAGPRLVSWAERTIDRCAKPLGESVRAQRTMLLTRLERYFGDQGRVGRGVTIGASVTVATLTLTGLLLLYYLAR
jgi:multicomponent Na+:H+ antiporter subunit D